MAIVGNIIVYIIMACMAVGGVASIIKPKSELGQQFIEGIQSIGPIIGVHVGPGAIGVAYWWK